MLLNVEEACVTSSIMILFDTLLLEQVELHHLRGQHFHDGLRLCTSSSHEKAVNVMHLPLLSPLQQPC